MPRLEQWEYGAVSAAWFSLPENSTQVLRGVVYGHPRHADGTFITTSEVVGRRGGYIVTRSGSEYELGEPNGGWLKAMSSSSERLIRSLPELPVAEAKETEARS